MVFPTVDFRAGKVHIIDQTLLPAEERMLELSTVDEVAEAIRSLRVRGAPAIGLAAAYGVLLALEVFLGAACAGRPDYFFDRMEGMRPFEPGSISVDEIRRTLREAGSVLAETRPTAVNLFWALGRMEKAGMREAAGVRELCSGLAGEAFAIHDEELKIEYAIAENGSPLIRDGMRILTHCNAGGLATAGYGTALGVIARAHEEGKHFTVYADETRPLLQGARLTAWELKKRGIDVTVLCDNAAASLFASSAIDAVIVGADRIASNGDTANKIGTLNLAILCERFKKPFYVAAPFSTFDLGISSGEEIPIEERAGGEVVAYAGRPVAPAETTAYNPAFDVTPASMITAIITEFGVVEHPDRSKLLEISGGKHR
jgi:methylthioribose-1-phosphate isomerase